MTIGAHALVNRYGVERVEADLMLGFFFPGAAMDDLPDEPEPASLVLTPPTATPA